MVSSGALVVCLALAGTGETVLLDFTAPWCGPCQAMGPTIKRLQTNGYPVRKIDIDQHPRLAAQYRVRNVPCFVMVSNGREAARVVGATSYDQLVRMYQNAGFRQSPPARPNTTRVHLAANRSLGGSDSSAQVRAAASLPAATAAPLAAGRAALLSPQQLAFQATVRLRVVDPRGHSVGTGTIIDTHGSEALLVTCGHIFRDSQGKGAIHVDVFPPGGKKTVAGQLIEYDLRRDIALISMRPGVALKPVPVAADAAQVHKGDSVFSIGCSRGADPSLQRSRVTAIDKYQGPANIEVDGQPVDGRSGGGLFSSRGELIGVCNAADPADNEGIYAALGVIHWQLSRIGLQRLYQDSGPEANGARAIVQTEPRAPASNRVLPAAELATLQPVGARAPNPPARLGKTDGGLDQLLQHVQQNPTIGEVICILRDDPSTGQTDKVVVLDRNELRRLRQLGNRLPGNQQVETRGGNPTSPTVADQRRQARPRANWNDQRDSAGRIIRAQSEY